jgi:hypothetical protein
MRPIFHLPAGTAFAIADVGCAHHSGRSRNQGNSRTRAYKVKSGKDLADLLHNSRNKTRGATSPKNIVSAAMEVPNSFAAKYAWLQKHFPFVPAIHFVFCGDKTIVNPTT